MAAQPRQTPNFVQLPPGLQKKMHFSHPDIWVLMHVKGNALVHAGGNIP